MTKQEAVNAMREGKKVTHRFFSPEEWMTLLPNSNRILLEDGVQVHLFEFFEIRDSSLWDEGYSLFE